MHSHEQDLVIDPGRTARHPRERHDVGAGQDALDALRVGRSEVATSEGIKQLQRTAGNAKVDRLLGEEDPAELVRDGVSGRGEALDPRVQRTMETELGADLSDVRVHTDSRAHESARALGARAYTVGSDVVFQQGQYGPGSRDGQRTLAHELTHVVQQRQGPVDGTPVGQSGIAVSDPRDRFEQAAERTADRAMASGSMQREVDDDLDDENLQMRVQREATDEEDEEEFS